MIQDDNIYSNLGVRTIINGRGTWTYLSGALINPEVKQAMEYASLCTVDVLELQRAVGKRIAKLAGAEAAMVTCGAAAAIAAGTAGCMAGTDPDRIYQLPDTTGMKNEVILGRRSVWDISIRLTGARLVVAETIERLHTAINENTAMVYWSGGVKYSAEDASTVCKRAGVPLFVDVASSIPCRDPVDALTKYAKIADLYTFSGGKGLCGPQTSGMLIGRTDLVEAALANSSPWEGAICRPMKVGKEEIVGALVAVEEIINRDHERDWLKWEEMSQRIAEMINGIANVKAVVGLPPGNYAVPHCIIEWNEKDLDLSTMECLKELGDGDPSIEVHSEYNPSMVRARLLIEQNKKRVPYKAEGIGWIAVCPVMLKPGEETIVGKRISDIFRRH